MTDIGWERRLSAASDNIATLGRRAWILLAASAAFALTYPFVPGAFERTLTVALATCFAVLAVGFKVMSWASRRRAIGRLRTVMAFVEHDATPAFVTDAQGEIVMQNRAARARFGDAVGDVMTRTLASLLANPDAVVHRLRDAMGAGAAREDIVTRHGHVRLGVNAIPEGQLWRLEDVIDGTARGGDAVAVPMLTVSSGDAVIWANEAMRHAAGRRASRLSDLFDDLPLRSGAVHRMHGADGPVAVRVVLSSPRADRRDVFLVPAEALGPDEGAGRALDAIPAAIVRLDDRGRVVQANRLALKLLPKAAEAGTPLASLVEGLGRPIAEWLSEASDGRGLNRPQMAHVAGTAESFVQITLGRPPPPLDAGLIAVLTDATELKTLEAQFVQSQKMQAIGQLAGGVAHDFNNLLTAISGHCDLLLMRREPDDPDFADLSQITQNANRAAALVGQLLAFSRKQTLRMEALDLRETLSDMTHLLNRLVGERIALTVDHDPALIPIRGDRRQLEQVLMNLVVNARDAMPGGGTVRIETEVTFLQAAMERDRATVPPGQYVVVRVTDAGRGIEPERIGRIFEPFFTTKRPGEGTGLGLSMAYGIVKQSGGYIFVDSEPGEGTTFTLWFPAGHGEPEVATRAAPGAVPAPSPRPAPPPATRTILLVEDEAPVRAVASRALKHKGYNVIEAESGEDALEQLEDPALDIDVFVTDVMMPGLDGPSWVREALRTRPEVRTVFMSGYTKDMLSEHKMPVPGAQFLAKPFSLPDLARTVERALS